MNMRVCADRAINIRAAPGITTSRRVALRLTSGLAGARRRRDETLRYNIFVSLFIEIKREKEKVPALDCLEERQREREREGEGERKGEIVFTVSRTIGFRGS